MTFQPPPPPPGNTPPPPPPGQWNPQPGNPGGPAGQGGSGKFDPKSVNPLDWAIIGIGVLAFLFSFIDFYPSADVSYKGQSATVDIDTNSAWHEIVGGGFFGWFAMVFAVAAAAALALSLFAPHVKLPLAARVLTVVLLAAASIFEILAIFITPGGDNVPSGYDVSINHGFGFWASLVIMLGGTVLALMRAQQTNTVLPGPLANMPKIGK